MKLGREVEGRFKGLMTLFLSAEEFFKLDGERGIMEAIAPGTVVNQVYVSDHHNLITIDNLGRWKHVTEIPITIECTSVRDRQAWQDNFHFMLFIDNMDFWRLRNTDQIKFSWNNYVRAITKECMHETLPEDFEGDEEIR